MVDAPSTLFETQRLLVRQITTDDLEAMYLVYSDPIAMQYVENGNPITRDECQKWVGVTLSNYTSRGYGMSAVTLKTDNSIIGFCGLVHPSGQSTPEIKYALLQAFWKQGYATETVSAMLKYGIEVHGLSRIIATIHSRNTASERVLRKVGMYHSESLANEDGTFTMVFELPFG